MGSSRNPLSQVTNIIKRTVDTGVNLVRAVANMGVTRLSDIRQSSNTDIPEPITPTEENSPSLVETPEETPTIPETNIIKPVNEIGNVDTTDSGLGDVESVFNKSVADPFSELFKIKKEEEDED